MGKEEDNYPHVAETSGGREEDNYLYAGLGTAFFSVLNVSFFSVLLKNATFFSVLFLRFWRLMKPKRTMRSFAKNVKNAKNVTF